MKLDSFQLKQQKLFEYWDNLKQIIMLDEDTFGKTKQEVRKAINYAMLTGIKDTEPATGIQRKRHVLNAREIKEIAEEKLEKTIEKANLYFHLNEMEKIGIITVVDAMPITRESKRHTSYYGRTAKVFLLEVDKEREELPILHREEFHQFLRILNPKLEKEEYQETIDKLAAINRYRHDLFKIWLEDNEHQLNQVDLDFKELYSLIDLVSRYDEKVFSGIKELKNLLGLQT